MELKSFKKMGGILLLLVALLPLANAQGGWRRTHDFLGQSSFGNVAPAADGGFMLLGAQSYPFNATNSYLFKADPEGLEVWKAQIPNNNYKRTALVLRETSDGGYLISGSAVDLNNQASGWDIMLLKIDAAGNEQWIKTAGTTDIESATSMLPLNGGDYMLAGIYAPDTLFYEEQEVFIARMNDAGDILWRKNHGDAGAADDAVGVATVPGGGYVLAYVSNTPTPNGWTTRSVRYQKTDASGDALGGAVTAAPFVDGCTGMAFDNSGMYLLVSDTLNGFFDYGTKLIKTDFDGATLWSKDFTGDDFGFPNGTVYFNDVQATADGGLVLSGNVLNKALIVKTDASGNLQWWKLLGDLNNQGYSSVEHIRQLTDGAYVGSGYKFSGTSDRCLIVKLDQNGNLYSNIVTGTLYDDANENCSKQTGEAAVNGMVVSAKNGTETYYGYALNNGIYSIDLPAGTYDVAPHLSHPYIEVCPAGATVNISGSNQQITQHFGIQDTIECPLLETSFYADRMRRCVENNYFGQVCNEGTADAADAYVEVTLDPWLSYESSTPPASQQNGQTLRFDIGTLEQDSCFHFHIVFKVSCDAPLGLTHCSEAHAYPDSLCVAPESSWDQSHIEVSGDCVGDSVVVFKTKNTGPGNMTGNTDFIVIEDDMIMLNDEIEALAAGAEKTIEIPVTDGETYRIEVNQSTGHPGISMPSATVEGCGLGNGQSISTGFVNMFSNDDADPWIDIDCQENRDSYDPNDKQAFPKGFDVEHYIERNTDIEYLIRFQNTGNDVAFNVVIRDTLSAALQAATIRPGVSSHAYTFHLSGQGVAIFTFDNINLPDQGSNEPLSHGFVSYRIAQQPDNPLETQILNKAAIYFDYNTPVITNETFHTVGENFVEVLSAGITSAATVVEVYPNPFVDRVILAVKDAGRTQTLHLQVFDMVGRAVLSSSSDNNRFELERGQLPSGAYTYRIVTAEGLLLDAGMMTAR